MLDPVADGDNPRDIELDPAEVGDRDVCLIEIGRRTCRAVANQPRAIGKLDHRPHLVKARRPDDPADLGERVRQVDEVVPIAQCRGARCRGRAGPEIEWIHIGRPADGNQHNLFPRWTMQRQLQVWIRDTLL